MTLSGHIVVTGGAGFIGSHLVERLLGEGRSVTVIDDLSTGSLENLRSVGNLDRLQVVANRISECPDLAGLLAGAEAVYHLAAAVGVELVMSSSLGSMENNLNETQVLLRAADQARVPVLLASTSEVYGKSQKPSFHEEDDLLIGPPHLNRWSYACSKLMDEFLGLAYYKERGLPVVVARLFNTVGPRQSGRYGMVLPRFIAAAREGRALPVHGSGLQTRCFCYVLDTVEALVRLQRTPAAAGQVFNVGNAEEVSILTLARLVIEMLQSSSGIRQIAYEEAYAAGFEDMLRRRPEVEKLARATGYRPATPLREIIRQTAAAATATGSEEGAR